MICPCRQTAILLSLLAAAPAMAVKLSQQTTRDGCSCLPWSEVYRLHGVKCGQGMEFYAWLGNADALKENDKRLQEVKYNLGDEFCTKFFEKMESNRAVKMKFNTPPSEAGKSWDKSWCYTSSECGIEDLDGGGYVPHKPVHWKIANNHHDVMMSAMRPDAIFRAAKNEAVGTGFDLSVMTGYAYYMSMGEDAENISMTMLREAQNATADEHATPMILQ